MIKNDFVEVFSEVEVIMSFLLLSFVFKIGSKIEDLIEMYLEELFTISSNLAGVPAMLFLMVFLMVWLLVCSL
jgi:Asp-tRNAAsn/Glu-tRNAGln amidotransferase A subunit and related amidases